MRGIHLWPVDSPHKGPVTREKFAFDDVIMVLMRAEKNSSLCLGPWHHSKSNTGTIQFHDMSADSFNLVFLSRNMRWSFLKIHRKCRKVMSDLITLAMAWHRLPQAIFRPSGDHFRNACPYGIYTWELIRANLSSLIDTNREFNSRRK